MAIFHYISVDNNGNTQKGIITAETETEARAKIFQMHLTLISLKPAYEAPFKLRWLTSRKKTVNTTTLSLLTLQLGTLLSAGFSIADALQSLCDQTDDAYLKMVLSNVRTHLLEGHTLDYGMNAFPDVFPDLYRATIAAGNKTGHLDEVINKLSTYLEQQNLIRQKIQQALIYPALLTLVSILIIAFLLTYAMPKIIKTFTESGQSLPAVTAFLLGISVFLKSYGVYILAIIVAVIIGIKRLFSSTLYRYRAQEWLLKIPILNEAMIITNSARFSRTFGILFAAGTPVIQAMQTANSIVTLLPMKKAIKTAIDQIAEGTPIHQALSQTTYFTKMSTQLIASGEKSSQLDKMLEKTANYQEQQVMRWISTLLALFEPVMILLMGVIILFIVLAILLPIFQMNEFFS